MENIALIALHVVGLAGLSVLNVYYIPGFVRRLGKDKDRRQFFAILIGFFGLVLCAPIIVIPLGGWIHDVYDVYRHSHRDSEYKKRFLNGSFPRRGDENVIVFRGVTEKRQAPGDGDRLQQ